MKSQIIQRAFDHLKPGGWLECQELNVLPACDDGTMTDDYNLLQWARDMDAASKAADRQLIIGDDIKQWLEEVGFVDVQQVVLKLPVGGWAREPRLKHLGMLWQRNLSGGLSGLSVGLLHRFGGKKVEQVEVSFCPRLFTGIKFQEHLVADVHAPETTGRPSGCTELHV